MCTDQNVYYTKLYTICDLTFNFMTSYDDLYNFNRKIVSYDS